MEHPWYTTTLVFAVGQWQSGRLETSKCRFESGRRMVIDMYDEADKGKGHKATPVSSLLCQTCGARRSFVRITRRVRIPGLARRSLVVSNATLRE